MQFVLLETSYAFLEFYLFSLFLLRIDDFLNTRLCPLFHSYLVSV